MLAFVEMQGYQADDLAHTQGTVRQQVILYTYLTTLSASTLTSHFPSIRSKLQGLVTLVKHSHARCVRAVPSIRGRVLTAIEKLSRVHYSCTENSAEKLPGWPSNTKMPRPVFSFDENVISSVWTWRKQWMKLSLDEPITDNIIYVLVYLTCSRSSTSRNKNTKPSYKSHLWARTFAHSRLG